MMAGSGSAPVAPGQRAGWEGLGVGAHVAYQASITGTLNRELKVGKVSSNIREEQSVILQPHRAEWSGVSLQHKPQFQDREGYSDEMRGDVAAERVLYQTLKFQVELLQDGQLTHGSVAKMKQSWGLYVPPAEVANMVSDRLNAPRPCLQENCSRRTVQCLQCA